MRDATADAASHRTALVVAGTLTFVGIAAVLALVIWNAWVVNYDGGAYLVLADRLRTGLGYTFPDGSAATFRGPLYPLAFSLVWIVAPVGEQTAIWVSRSFVAMGSIATAWIVWLSLRRAIASGVAGLAAAVQPLVFASGAFYFVPDGMAAVFLLVGTAIAAPGVGARYGRWRPWLAGVAFGLGTLTKETAVFGLLVAAVLAFNSWRRRPALAALSQTTLAWAVVVGIWSIWVLERTGHLPAPFAAATGPGAWVLLLGALALLIGFWWIAGRLVDISNAPRTEASIRKMLVAMGVLAVVPFVFLLTVVSPAVQAVGDSREVVVGAGPGLAGMLDLVHWFAIGVLALIGAAFTVREHRHSQLIPPMLLISLGLGLAAWGSLSGFGMRNGAILAYGLAWLLGVVVADWSDRDSANTAWRVAAVALVGGFVWLNVAGLTVANRWIDQDAPSWDAPGVQRAADWLSENGRGRITAGTPVFINYLSFRTSGAFDARLVPVYETDRDAPSTEPMAFDRRVWWAAHVSQSPAGAAELGRTYSRKFVSSIVEEDLLLELRDTEAELLVVTGIAPSEGAYDGLALVPYLEVVPWARRVYTSAASEMPYWIFIYELTDGPSPTPSPPVTIYTAFPSRPHESQSDQSFIGPREYEAMIRSIVEAGG